MTLDYISKKLNNKIANNEKIIKYTFFELRVQENLSDEEMKVFLELARIKLKNMDYKVYLTGEKYFYFQEEIVKENELLVAIKNT